MIPRPWKSEIHLIDCFLVAAAIAVGVASVSNQSFWIDEANSAIRAVQPTMSGFWSENIRFGGSDLQMPGYMLSLWAWEKAFGHGEYALRAINIPLFLTTIVAALFLLDSSTRLRRFFAAVLCASPMVWVYMDEARPYIFQLTGAIFALIGTFNQGKKPASITKNTIVFCAGAMILCASSLTGFIFTFFFFASHFTIILIQGCFRLLFKSKDCLIILFSTFLFIFVFFIYYTWTLSIGARGSGHASTNLGSIGFCGYELLGFMGFGPGRLELRTNGIAALSSFLPGIIFFFIITTLLLKASFHFILKTNPPNWVWTLAVSALAGVFVLVFVGLTKDFRVLGRHLIPTLPFILLFFAWSMDQLWSSKKTASRALVLLYFFSVSFSSVSTRYENRFGKDDYRSAASSAKSFLERGKKIWWAADKAGILFYLPQAEQYINAGTLCFPRGHEKQKMVNKIQFPTAIFVSREDIYDIDGFVQDFVLKNHYKLTGRFRSFLIFSK